jgi:hypothetical protein
MILDDPRGDSFEESRGVGPRLILLLFATAARLQSVAVTGSSEHCSVFFLAAHKGILHPRVGQDVVHGSTLARIQFQHAANDVPSLTWKQTEQAHRTLDSALLARVRRLTRRRFGRGIVVLLVALVVVSASLVARRWLGLCAALRVVVTVSVRGHGATVCLHLTLLLWIRRGDEESV